MILYLLILPSFPTTFLAQPFCAVFQPLGGLHIRCVVMACFAEAVSNWTVIQFSNPGYPDDIFQNKRRITIIRPITENVPCGRSYRNPSNMINILAFLNVRLQCNIRGRESQGSAETASNSLHSVHFRCLTSDYKKVTIPLTIPIGIENYKKHLRLLRRTII